MVQQSGLIYKISLSKEYGGRLQNYLRRRIRTNVTPKH